MSSYLDRIGAGFILNKPEVFGFDYVPEILVGREELQGQLASLFTTIGHPEGTGRAVVTGPVGSGKTALVKRFCDDLIRHVADKRNIKYVHVNCRNASTASRVMQKIVQDLDPGHPDRGLGVGELLTSLRRMLQGDNSHIIVVLDEVDHLLRHSGDDIIYKLMRIDEDGNRTGTLSAILISQEQVLDMLENAVISRLGRSNHIRVPPYDENGLLKIATQRRDIGLVAGTCTEEILNLISQAAAPSGDARQAIELLEGAAKRAESSGRSLIESKDVQKTVITLPNNVDSMNIEDIPPHAMLVLLGLCRRLKKKENVTSGEAEKLYHVVCEEYDQDPKGHTTFWKHLKRLAQEDIIVSKTAKSDVGRGRTQHISMPHMLPSDVARRLETLIPSRLR
ncbi:MAG: AAA family ATPase [Euryarchaeota archaeon]|jgi:cell division control protein 6|nr:AAA family ATPase [Euryarchaeota archaeon]MBT7245152.1 AAA family ATPase [Euryarchaeota archaeon]